jgi:hypothetical protein
VQSEALKWMACRCHSISTSIAVSPARSSLSLCLSSLLILLNLVDDPRVGVDDRVVAARMAWQWMVLGLAYIHIMLVITVHVLSCPASCLPALSIEYRTAGIVIWSNRM